MQKIIVPVDFSIASFNAYIYARKMALKLKAELEVVHVYDGSFDPNEPLFIKSGMGREDAILDRLSQFLHHTHPEHKDEEDINVETRAILGGTVKQLVELSKEENTLMLIMGTTGASDVLERWLGSISSEVARQAFKPVLLVPKEARFKDFDQILYASNFESADEEIIEEMAAFAQLFSAGLHFIHVTNEGEANDYEKTEERIFDQLFEDDAPTIPVSFASIASQSIMEGIEKYAIEHEVDMIVMVHRERKFLERLIHKSLTKKLAMYSKIPVMVFHL